MATSGVFAISVFLTVTWGIYFAGTLRLYIQSGTIPTRRREEQVIALRRVLVAACIWSLVASIAWRSGITLLGFQSDPVGQIIFFTLAGTNVAGSIFAAISLWFD